MFTARGNKHRAFTIVEASIATLLVGVLLSASMMAVGALAQSRRIQAERRAAYALAKQLMSEIMAMPFKDPDQTPGFGPEAGETSRALFDDVDDYDGYTASPPTAKDGTPLTGYTGWTRSAAVVFVDPANPAVVVASSTLKRITVTVTMPSGKLVSIVGWRSQYGAYDTQLQQATNYVTWVGVDVQVGPTSTPIRTGARPLNESVTQP
jgi:type II secretory pathway pseudopilin PulG